ncbi:MULTISPECIES: SDR family NAD(P)-dependent oxidoreductase [Sphingobacterium]|uniref:Rhamnolipids biosynthesis 3-oxoacyl-[acyl-carrier-protein] reductase n=1 Tax=Sphingobacterium multivorum TaxID=28454 RepID=A0A2X2JLC4_SPHMU|nr:MULTISPECIES: SDR family NAD(P)-dependent oxidoreductase [Sphingobacterium]QRQ62334.1 SDR family NAD(P)-dependent oxidoreductase [Sphingobacterium multivorum]SPZ92593.1 Rhamnolipids biosynthesis 3-oxoacyl-[acyl-carrier-protein] reductase [Sphingobacterium multivorum]
MKTVLITGANKGIGFETARQLLEKGFFVFIGSRNIENGLQAVQKLNAEGFSNVEAVELDVTDPASVRLAREEIGNKVSVLDVLINNAGINGGSELAYWLFPKINGLLTGKEKKKATLVMPYYQNKGFGIGLVQNF